MTNLGDDTNHSGGYKLRIFEEEIIFDKDEQPEKYEDSGYFSVDDVVDDETIDHCDKGAAYSEKEAKCRLARCYDEVSVSFRRCGPSEEKIIIKATYSASFQ